MRSGHWQNTCKYFRLSEKQHWVFRIMTLYTYIFEFWVKTSNEKIYIFLQNLYIFPKLYLMFYWIVEVFRSRSDMHMFTHKYIHTFVYAFNQVHKNFGLDCGTHIYVFFSILDISWLFHHTHMTFTNAWSMYICRENGLEINLTKKHHKCCPGLSHLIRNDRRIWGQKEAENIIIQIALYIFADLLCFSKI